MILWTQLSLWSQDSKLYTRSQREIIAIHNLERLECLENTTIKDSTISDFIAIVSKKDSIFEAQNLIIGQYENSINDYDKNIKILNEDNLTKSKKIKSLKKSRRIWICILTIETIILALCLH